MVRILPRSRKFGQDSPKSAKFGPASAKFGPEFGPVLANDGPDSGTFFQNPTKFPRIWPELARIRFVFSSSSYFGRFLPQSGESWTRKSCLVFSSFLRNRGRHEGSSQSGPGLTTALLTILLNPPGSGKVDDPGRHIRRGAPRAEFCPKSAKNSQIRPHFAEIYEIWPDFGQFGATSTEFGPVLAKIGPDSGTCFRYRTNSPPKLAKVGFVLFFLALLVSDVSCLNCAKFRCGSLVWCFLVSREAEVVNGGRQERPRLDDPSFDDPLDDPPVGEKVDDPGPLIPWGPRRAAGTRCSDSPQKLVTCRQKFVRIRPRRGFVICQKSRSLLGFRRNCVEIAGFDAGNANIEVPEALGGRRGRVWPCGDPTVECDLCVITVICTSFGFPRASAHRFSGSPFEGVSERLPERRHQVFAKIFQEGSKFAPARRSVGPNRPRDHYQCISRQDLCCVCACVCADYRSKSPTFGPFGQVPILFAESANSWTEFVCLFFP